VHLRELHPHRVGLRVLELAQVHLRVMIESPCLGSCMHSSSIIAHRPVPIAVQQPHHLPGFR
jgi:hypothetical protein